MSTAKSLAKRLQEVLLDGTWIANTNWKDQLNGVDWRMATYKVASFNTIAQLTYHINYYLQGILEVFQGGELTIRDQYSFDLPAIQSECDWQNLTNKYLKNAKLFVSSVAQFSEDQLQEDFVKKEYGSYQRNIEAVIEHSYYHLGQLVLIKKEIEKI